ncbi:MAG: hypothetical protein CSB55_04010 [Candidatus Cloacimonadota bacterium]|nr:MAG: hypothetical protein CSB55_04010 [Candidatus Cloacimonadota bacterium]
MNWLKNQYGSIVVSMVIALIAAVAGLTMASRAFSVGQDFINDLILTQEIHSARGQLRFGSAVSGRLSDFNMYVLPDARYELDHGFIKRSYIMRTKLSKNLESTNYTAANIIKIKTNVRCFNKKINSVSYHSHNRSHLQLYAEQGDRKETFAGYMYLTNTDESENAAEGPDAAKVKFWGRDEIFGRVHSNSDIWIMNGGGGSNNGWPLFHDHVSTAGEVQWESSGGNIDDIFTDGLTENAGVINWNPEMSSIRKNGTELFSGLNDVDYIHVQMNDGGYVAKAIKVVWEPDTMIVRQFPGFPPYSNELGDSIGLNNMRIPIDTLLLDLGSGDLTSGHSYFVENKLFFEGRVRGSITWGCADTLYLTDDIYYAGTEKGESADGVDENGDYTGTANTRDFLGLVSEKRIYIKYKCLDLFGDWTPGNPIQINDGNCNDIYIYAALAALAKDEDPIKEGIFSFEYQHPHPSTPIVQITINGDSLLHNRLTHFPDLHLNQFPWGNGWSTQNYNVIGTMSPPDYPWYNPVWPEIGVVGERGAIRLFGSVAQTRRGFVHRSGHDPANHTDGGDWLWGENVPKYGPEHSPSGYDKDYHYDYRFMRTPPPDFPEVHVTSGESPRERVSLRFKVTPINF